MSKFHYFVITYIAFAGLSLSGCKDKDKEKTDVVTQQKEVKEEPKQEEQVANKLPEKWRNKNCLRSRRLKIVGGSKACWNGSIEINNLPQEGCGGDCNEDQYIDLEIEDKEEIERMGKSIHTFLHISKYGAMACGTGDWRWEVIERWAGAFKIDGNYLILKDDNTCFAGFEYNGMGHIRFEKVNKLEEAMHSLHPAGTHPCFRGNSPSVFPREMRYDSNGHEIDYNPSDVCKIYDENYENKVNKLIDDILKGKVVVKNVDEVISYINEYFVDTVKKMDEFYRKNECDGLFKNEQQLKDIMKILNQKEGRTGYKTGAKWDLYNFADWEEGHGQNIAILKQYADLFKNDN